MTCRQRHWCWHRDTGSGSRALKLVSVLGEQELSSVLYSAALAARHTRHLSSRLCPLLLPTPLPSPSPHSSLLHSLSLLTNPSSLVPPPHPLACHSLPRQWVTPGTPSMATLGAVHSAVQHPGHCSAQNIVHGATHNPAYNAVQNRRYGGMGSPVHGWSQSIGGREASRRSSSLLTAAAFSSPAVNVPAVTSPARRAAAPRPGRPSLGPGSLENRTVTPSNGVTVRSLASDTVTEDTVTEAAPGAEGVFPEELPKAFDFTAEPRIYEW